MKQSLGLIALIIFVAGISVVLSAQDQRPGGRPLSIALSGSAEVPGPGDPDGTGQLQLTLNPGKNEVCYELKVDQIETPTAAHIHAGIAGKSGPPVLTLTVAGKALANDCATLDAEIIKAILKDPSGYYVNVHNAEYPDGAVRGQLGR